MIILRDLYYDDNKVEMIIGLRDKQFDGEINKAIVDIKFKFGIQCYESIPMACIREFEQEINQEIIWTEYDVERLFKQVNYIVSSFEEDKDYTFIGLLEQEFEAICFFTSREIVSQMPEEVLNELSYDLLDEITLFITVGIAGIGPSIKLRTTKDELMRWANEIKDEFYDVN